ncbi:MAG: hypothetical protein Q7U47_15755, partial [Paludibacter sp.]|nr:hypothetical protein [Paludibacter sp.]
MNTQRILLFYIIFNLFACKSPIEIPNTVVESVNVNGSFLASGGIKFNVPVDSVLYSIVFSTKIDKSKLNPDLFFITNGVDTSFVILKDTFSRQINFKIRKNLSYYNTYTLHILSGNNFGVNFTDDTNYSFITELNTTDKFLRISNDSLLT